MGQSKPEDNNSSDRCYQTVKPLADRLGLEVQRPYTRKKADELVKTVLHDKKNDGQIVLICWYGSCLRGGSVQRETVSNRLLLKMCSIAGWESF